MEDVHDINIAIPLFINEWYNTQTLDGDDDHLCKGYLCNQRNKRFPMIFLCTNNLK